jgi:hypothetical protein
VHDVSTTTATVARSKRAALDSPIRVKAGSLGMPSATNSAVVRPGLHVRRWVVPTGGHA